MVTTRPLPIELTDPFLAEELRLICRGEHQDIKALRQVENDFVLIPKPVKAKVIGRNDPCPCGSGKKYKRCCLRN
jgi:uncharacterized protein YecA (UPF0149 family)